MRDWIMLLAMVAGGAGGCAFDGLGFGNGDGEATPGAGEDATPEVEEICYFGMDPGTPAATLEYVLEVMGGIEVVHVRLTLSPRFNDNTYGANAIDWGDRGHAFKDLVGSDHAQLQLFDGAGQLVAELKLDYLSIDPSAPSGYGTLGVAGGDGKMLLGDATAIVASSTSMARNLNERGLASYLTDSPLTDAAYTANPAAPGWDYRVIYELAVRTDAFGPAGFGDVTVRSIHASPSKHTENTLVVDPRPCPPDWHGFCDAGDDGCDPGSGIPGDCGVDGCAPGPGTTPEG